MSSRGGDGDPNIDTSAARRPPMHTAAAERRIYQADALEWLSEHPAPEGASVITSLPDLSELPHLDFAGWRAWFIDAAARVIRWVPDGGVSIFYQSDIRIGGSWIDKGYLVMRGAEETGAAIVWHKIVCRKPPGTIALGRPSYSHMICVSRDRRAPAMKPGPDVLADAGHMPWSRAMGVSACRLACRFLLDETRSKVVIDPFCGRGTVLAVANTLGLDAIGVDISAKRCRAARALVIEGASDNAQKSRDPRSTREAFENGARLFDQGAFWEAHEAWESRWHIEPNVSEKRFFQGLIQIAAALHQLFIMGSQDAYVRLLSKGLAKLDTWPSDFDLARFRAGIEVLPRTVGGQGFDRNAIPKLLA